MNTAPAQLSHTPQFMRHSTSPDIPESLAAAFSQPTNAKTLLKTAAWKSFSTLGLPRTADEDYSFVSLAEIRAALSAIPSAVSNSAIAVESNAAWQKFDPNSDAFCIDSAANEIDAPAALAMAFGNPIGLRINGGARVENPLQIHLRGGSERRDASLFVDLASGSAAKIHLRAQSVVGGFLNAALFFRLGPGAELDLACEDWGDGVHTQKILCVLERDAQLRLVSTSTGGALHRLSVQADLTAAGAALDIRGAAALGGNRRCHRHLRVRHQAPDGISNQLFKTVVSDAGRGSVDGTVTVDRGAQRTDARQLIRHLLLSKGARADSKPRLLIHADDVRCSHGAATGKLDPAQQFYLRSRGLDTSSANRLLTQAFLSEALDAIVPEFREPLQTRLLNALSGNAK